MSEPSSKTQVNLEKLRRQAELNAEFILENRLHRKHWAVKDRDGLADDILQIMQGRPLRTRRAKPKARKEA